MKKEKKIKTELERKVKREKEIRQQDFILSQILLITY